MVRAISDNSNGSKTGKRIAFTPSAATKMLPLVRLIVADMMRLSHLIDVRRERLYEVDGLPETIDQPDYREELSDIRESLAEDELQLQAYLSELSALGLQAHLPFDGSVDFPALMNRRLVRLCWHHKDDQVEHWHEVGQSQNKRQKIDSLNFFVESLN